MAPPHMDDRVATAARMDEGGAVAPQQEQGSASPRSPSPTDLDAARLWAEAAAANAEADTVDVAVIGNGPAGIALSWMLAGHVPYYDDSSGPHPNAVLHEKLAQRRDVALVDQDLAWLSDGLEGRSANPVALLLDALHHPNSDIDVVGSQAPRLRWAYEPARARSHVVIGRGPPGGSWASMHEEMETVSYGSWMQLPGYPIAAWAADQGLADLDSAGSRLKRRFVARYYEDYVLHEGLGDHFLSGWQVVAMRRIRAGASGFTSPPPTPPRAPSPPPAGRASVPLEGQAALPPCAWQRGARTLFGWAGATCATLQGRPARRVTTTGTTPPPALDGGSAAAADAAELWAPPCEWELLLMSPPAPGRRPEPPLLDGAATGATPAAMPAKRLFRVVCARHVVIATGMFDVPRRLEIPGEDLRQFVFHSPAAAGALLRSPAVAAPIVAAAAEAPASGAPPPPQVVVVGSGLSAADAILVLRRSGFSVVHLFWHRRGLSPLAKCPRESYPEYASLYREMRKGQPVVAPCGAVYTPVQDGELVRIEVDSAGAGVGPACRVTWRTHEGELRMLDPITAVLVLIGSEPSLTFLPPCLAAQTRRARATRPLAIHPITFAWPNERALSVIGSLTGDNFVRFLLGGALATAATVQKTLASAALASATASTAS